MKLPLIQTLPRAAQLAFATFCAYVLLNTVTVLEYTSHAAPIRHIVFPLAGGLVILGWVAARSAHRNIPRPTAWATASFCALMGYAAISALLHPHVVGKPPALERVSLWWVLPVPLLASMTVVFAMLTVSVIPARRLFSLAWWVMAGGTLVTPLGWLLEIYTVDPTQASRLATRLGGAAVLPVVLLLGLGVALAAALSEYRRRPSVACAVINLAMLLATDSRGGILGLAALGALTIAPPVLGAWRSGKLSRRGKALILGGVLGLIVAIFAAFHVASRRLSSIWTDGRWTTWTSALAAYSRSVGTMIFGTGYATLWPWNYLEQTGQFHNLCPMPHGETLSHAHNTFIAVLAELGVVGLLLLLGTVAVTVWCFVAASSTRVRVLGAALTATLVPMLVDTYLIRNFALSYVWWVFLFAVVAMVHHESQTCKKLRNSSHA